MPVWYHVSYTHTDKKWALLAHFIGTIC